jgi:alkyl hydroperoxide reductase subunit AhpC
MSLLSINDTLPSVKAHSQSSAGFELAAFCKGSYAVVFSYPEDYTPICSTEVVDLIRRKAEFEARGAKVVGLSNDSPASHASWLSEIESLAGSACWFPVLSDERGTASLALGMAAKGKRISQRTLYIVDPELKVVYVSQLPQNCGRDFAEVLRVLDSCQLTKLHKVVGTPAGWQSGQDVVMLPTSNNAPKPFLQFAQVPADKHSSLAAANTFQSLQPLFHSKRPAVSI